MISLQLYLINHPLLNHPEKMKPPHPYIFAGLRKEFQEIAYNPFVKPDALPLYEAINKEIANIGSRKLAIEYLKLENQKLFGWRETDIHRRIHVLNNALKKKVAGKSSVHWSKHELKILKNNPNKTAREISYLISRTVNAIHFRRHKLSKYPNWPSLL